MFLNENANATVDVDAIIAESKDATYAIGLEGALQMNLEAAEMYHESVEQMIVAEHTSIVNEDANLLSEAKEGFMDKVKKMFKVIKEKIIGMWNKVKEFFQRLCTTNKALAQKVKDAKTLAPVTLEKGYDWKNQANINGVGGKIYAAGIDIANKYQAVVNASTDSGEAQLAALKGKMDSLSVSGIKFGGEHKNYVASLNNAFMGKQGKYTYDASTVKAMGAFVGDYNKSIAQLKAGFEQLIKWYNNLEKYFDGLAKSLQKDAASKSAKASAVAKNCRKIAGLLNTAIGVATDCNKRFYSLAKTVCVKALGGKADDKKSDDVETGNILDRFAL